MTLLPHFSYCYGGCGHLENIMMHNSIVIEAAAIPWFGQCICELLDN